MNNNFDDFISALNRLPKKQHDILFNYLMENPELSVIAEDLLRKKKVAFVYNDKKELDSILLQEQKKIMQELEMLEAGDDTE